jgi:hypothetical protein
MNTLLFKAGLESQRELRRLKGWVIGVENTPCVVHGGWGGWARNNSLDSTRHPGRELNDVAREHQPELVVHDIGRNADRTYVRVPLCSEWGYIREVES